VHDLHLPTLLAHASGTVVINSTVGPSALHHKVPSKTTGSAFYDMEA
jgi:capsular polysaccharide export protein